MRNCLQKCSEFVVRGVDQLVECLPKIHEVLGLDPRMSHTFDVVAHACNPSTREVEAEDQKFKIIISYIKKKSLGIAWHGEAYL